MSIINVFIIEDEPLILSHHKSMLRCFDDLFISGITQCGQGTLRAISQQSSPPDVILCDSGSKSLYGLKIARHVKALYPRTEILVYTAFLDENMMLEAINAGACGFLVRGDVVDIGKIREAIIDIHHGGSIMPPALTRKLLRLAMPKEKMLTDFMEHEDLHKKKHSNVLTQRELECLQIVAKGLSNQETASVLQLSKTTVRTHLEHIYQKLDVTNRVEAITEDIRQGIIEL